MEGQRGEPKNDRDFQNGIVIEERIEWEWISERR